MSFTNEGTNGGKERELKGRFTPKQSLFRSFIKADGTTPFMPEPGRYRLYIALACPWASRCFMTIKLKGLENAVPITVVHHQMGPKGWHFIEEDALDKPYLTSPDPLFAFKYLREFYTLADPNYDGRVTVPMLWDTKTNTLVNNESSEIIVMLNNEFNEYAAHPEVDLYPVNMRPEIDAISESVQKRVNIGVYRCGFATTQEAYDEGFEDLFKALDELEKRLASSRYLCGDQLTLADIRLFPTLIRFDTVYATHFKTNLHTLKEYPNLNAFTRELYQIPAIRATVNWEHIKNGYYASQSMRKVNPLGIVPRGPDLSYLDEPHGRERLNNSHPWQEGPDLKRRILETQRLTIH